MDRYAVIGCPVGHSRSPRIHRLFAEQTGARLSYDAVEVEAGGVADFLAGFAASEGRGANVTLPLKEEAYRTAAGCSERAALAGAVNTLSRTADGSWLGDNTDGLGLLRDLTVNHAVPLRGRRLLLLGAGGAMRGVLGPLLDQGPAAVVLANRTRPRAEALAQRFAQQAKIAVRTFQALAGQRFDVVINATSAGLHGESVSLPQALFASDGCAYDLSYGEAAQPFLETCRALGAARVLDGLGMLVEQAAESFLIWRGIRPETAPVIAALRGA